MTIQPPEHYYILKGEDGLYSWRATPLNATHLRETRKAACASAEEHRDRIIASATPAIEKKVKEELLALPSGLDESVPPPGYEWHTFTDGTLSNAAVSLLGTGGPAMTLAVAWHVFKRDARPLVEVATSTLRTELEAAFEKDRGLHLAFAEMDKRLDQALAKIERLTALGTTTALKTTEDQRNRYRRNLPVDGLREDFVDGLVEDVDTLLVEVARLKQYIGDVPKEAP